MDEALMNKIQMKVELTKFVQHSENSSQIKTYSTEYIYYNKRQTKKVNNLSFHLGKPENNKLKPN